MAVEKQKNIKAYNKLMKEINNLLESKRVSYAQFSQKIGIPAVSFYNRYKSYGFTVEEMMVFVSKAREISPNMIKCLKCNSEFVPKTKSVKRAFCESCKDELSKKAEASESLKFRYPAWVPGVSDWAIRSLVEQEFHIDEETALAMSKATTSEEAKTIRANRWKGGVGVSSSFASDAVNYIKFSK